MRQPDGRKIETHGAIARRRRIVKFRFAALVATLALLPSSGARSQVTVDMAKLSCTQYLTGKFAPRKYVALWLSGYYHGKSNNTVIDPATLEANNDKIDNYCNGHRDAMIMDAVKNALGLNK